MEEITLKLDLKGEVKLKCVGILPVALWIKIHLPVQRSWVPCLVQEDSTCCRAAKPVHDNY